VAYLRATRVLDKLYAAGFKPFVSEREVEYADTLIELESRAEAIDRIVERLRSALASGIERDVVKFDAMLKADTIHDHPDIAVVQLAGKVNAIVCDDRFINQHRRMDGTDGSSAIWTSLDAIWASQAGDAQERLWRHRTILRQAGYIFVPTSADELAAIIARSTTRDGSVIETGELRAFRENLQLAQMQGWLSLPLEAHWLNKMVADIVDAVRAQWNDSVPEANARARSEWLLKCADLRNWAGQIEQGDGLNMARFGLALSINSLLLSHFQSRGAAARFEQWLQAVVNGLKDEDPTVYQWMLEALRAAVLRRVANGG
jgi:hypothetical protein